VNEGNKPDQPQIQATTHHGDLDDDEGGGFTMNSQSRALLMQKLQRASLASGAIPTSLPLETNEPEEISEPSNLSTCIVLRNMFDPASETDINWDLEIRDDVKEECSKYGSVIHIFVDRESQGCVYMKFGSIPGAQNASNALNGRWFAGRMVTAEYINEPTYYRRFPEAQ